MMLLIEQNARVGLVRDCRQKLPFRQRPARKFEVSRGVLEDEALAENLLHLLHPANDVAESFLRQGERQEVVRISAANAREAQMIGDPARAGAIAKGDELTQVVEIERVGGADVQRHPVQRKRVALGDAIQELERTPPRVQEVVAQDLEPRDLGPLREEVLVVRGAQTYADAEIRESEPRRGRRARFRAQPLQPPWPLQAF